MQNEFTEKQVNYIQEQYRRIEDRLHRAKFADYATAHDMLLKVMHDTKKLRQMLQKSKFK